MCGICGIAGNLERAEREGRVGQAMRMLAHRGPDGSDLVSLGKATFGHTRLAIIDLRPQALEPMFNESEEMLLVFNGEIYNHQELRANLKDHLFRSQMDGEVILHLYEDRRERCVESLLGMFAFAVWDRNDQRLFLGRDRFGQKPLYYSVKPSGLYFASEIPSLLYALGEIPELSLEALHEFLYFQYIHGPRTVFNGVVQLPPGHVLAYHVPTGDLVLSRYFHLEQHVRRALSFGQAREQFASELARSTGSQLIADVPLGVFLSGGIDSASIAWAAKQAKEEVITFTAAFGDTAYNEAPAAARTAAHLGTSHHTFPVTPDLAGTLPRIVRSFGNPFADPSILPTWELARSARQVVKVALAGDGADELLAGYGRFIALKLASMGPVRHAAGLLAPFLPLPGNDVRAPLDRLLRFVHNAGREDLSQVNLHLKVRWDGSVDDWLLADGFKQAAGVSRPMEAYFDLVRRVQANSRGRRGFGILDAIAVDVGGYLADDILVKADIMSMAHGLEVRAPFLDHHLAGFVSALPVSHRLGYRKGKRVLREAMHGRLRPETTGGRKLGFGIPLARWLRTELEPLSREVLHDSPFVAAHFAREGIVRLETEHREGRLDRSQELWALMVLALWHEGVQQWRADLQTR